MAKVTATGSRRRFTGATFGGSTRAARRQAEKDTQKEKLARARRAFVDKKADAVRLVERVKLGRLLDRRALIRSRLLLSPLGNQLSEALAAAFSKKP